MFRTTMRSNVAGVAAEPESMSTDLAVPQIRRFCTANHRILVPHMSFSSTSMAWEFVGSLDPTYSYQQSCAGFSVPAGETGTYWPVVRFTRTYHPRVTGFSVPAGFFLS